MFARMQRNLFALAVASTAVGAIVLVSQGPQAVMQVTVAAADTQALPAAPAPPSAPVEPAPAADPSQTAVVRSRPLKLSLPDFLNLGAPRRSRSPA